ncbi:hypothetical protein MERGE_002989 [Pneumocystis wakefieldiae]|uniref:NAD-dependent epimerase/dehydratase domain-containing protein n=1 Tax=Pneumocystis wakefieldiae TaxID=38082 RepID=A0A899FYU2_9ASCO|nr:hypothetical protein MERGE_002989 [Pneumocystis wakefieldiae]
MNHHLAVFGGTGFLGRHICKAAVQKGWTVTSISRRGVPNSDQHDGNIQNWTQQKIIYKGFLSGRDSLFSLFQLSQDEDLSYDKLNRDFAIQIADMVSQANKNIPFVYLSAANTFPGIPRKYIETKREAEDYICSVQNIRPIIMRPGLMYSKERPITLPLAGIIDITSNINKLFCGKIPFLNVVGVKPLKVETVANAIIQSIHKEFKGIASVEHIEKLASALQKTHS